MELSMEKVMQKERNLSFKTRYALQLNMFFYLAIF